MEPVDLSEDVEVCKNIFLAMPEKYFKDALSVRIRGLLDEIALQDADMVFSGEEAGINSFLLSMLSPVLHKMVCGGFKESTKRKLRLEDINRRCFEKLVSIALGEAKVMAENVEELLQLNQLADRLQMTEVCAVLEDATLKQLNVQICAEVLRKSETSGLGGIEKRCYDMVRDDFEQVTKTAGFLELQEETLGKLLDDDWLSAYSEESVLEGLVRWMKAAGEGLRGESLLRKIRYGTMEDHYLAGLCLSSGLASYTVLEELVKEAHDAKSTDGKGRKRAKPSQLCEKAFVRRRGQKVNWERYAKGGERKLRGHNGLVCALVDVNDRICSGSQDGTIRVWNKITLEEELTLSWANRGPCLSLAVWNGLLVSGHEKGIGRAWNLETGKCVETISMHTRDVLCLATCGTRLLSGSSRGTVKVWSMMAPTRMAWVCETTLKGHKNKVNCLTVWEGKVLSGSSDHTVRVWNIESRVCERTLCAHDGAVTSMTVARDRLVTASLEGEICVWSLATWELVEDTITEANEGADILSISLGVTREGLISALAFAEEGEVEVWDMALLECEHSLEQPEPVNCLLAMDSEVWAGVGGDVVVWGR